MPVQDMMKVRSHLDQKGVRLIGPNCPGLLTPGEAKVGIIPGHVASPATWASWRAPARSPMKSLMP